MAEKQTLENSYTINYKLISLSITFLLTCCHSLWLQTDLERQLVLHIHIEPLLCSHAGLPCHPSGWEKIVLEQLTLQSGHREAQPLDRVVRQSQGLGKLHNLHITLILHQEAQSLVGRSRSMM